MDKKNRIFGGWKRCVWGVGILAVSLILVWVVLDIASGIKLRRAIAAWQDAGLPMDIREATPDPVPEEENAAVVLNHVIDFSYPEGRESRLVDHRLRRIEQEAVAMGEELFSILTAGGDVPSGLVEDLETAVGDPLLVHKRKIARRAVEYERFDAYLEYELAFELLVPHVGEMRRLGQLLQAEAVLNAATDRWPEAYDALLVSVQLADLLGDEPLLISKLTRRALHRSVLERLERFLQIRPPGIDQSPRLRGIFSEAETSEILPVISLEKIVFALHLYRLLEEGAFTPSRILDFQGESYRWLDKGLFRPIHKADVATFMDAARRRHVPLGSPSAGVDYNEILGEMEKMETDGPSEFPFYAFVTGQVFPAGMDRIFLNEWEIMTRLALARTALAAHAYRATANAWPQTLEDLVPEYLPEVPEDPFGDGLLRYERGDGRVVLYSIGPDRTDDGGQMMEKVESDAPGDLVWVLEGESL